MPTKPEIQLIIKPAPLDDVLEPAFAAASKQLRDMYVAAPAMLRALERTAKLFKNNPKYKELFADLKAVIDEAKNGVPLRVVKGGK